MSSVNIVAHNLQGMFTNRQLGIVNTDKKKSSEKLSTGYKINRAADDAAGIRNIFHKSHIAVGTQPQIAFGIVLDASYTHILHFLRKLVLHSFQGILVEYDEAFIRAQIQIIAVYAGRVYYLWFKSCKLAYISESVGHQLQNALS